MDSCNDDIINIIVNNISDSKSIFNFIITNKYFYNLLKINLNKLKIEYFFYNNKYLKFYECLQKFNYNKLFLNCLFIKAIKNIKTVWSNNQNGFYDMRYIFELMFIGYELNNELIIINNLQNNNFYRNFYYDLKKTIIYKNRSETIKNINNTPILTSLKQNFTYYNKNNETEPYLHLITSSKRFK